MQSYILIYSRLRNREHLIALGSQQGGRGGGGGAISASAVGDPQRNSAGETRYFLANFSWAEADRHGRLAQTREKVVEPIVS